MHLIRTETAEKSGIKVEYYLDGGDVITQHNYVFESNNLYCVGFLCWNDSVGFYSEHVVAVFKIKKLKV